MKQLLAIFLFMLCLASCDPKRVYETYHETGAKGWHKDSIYRFSFDITDTVQAHNLYINVRNLGSYQNSNLWMFLAVESPGATSVGDTVEFTLADNKGKWLGHGIGDIFDNQFIYRSNVYFPKKGKYTFSMQHGMRDDILKGICDVGIRVERTK